MRQNRMQRLYQQYAGALEDWQIKLALSRLQRFRVPQEAWEDTMQELAIVICEFRYDPARAHAASERTILCRALDNRIRTLARGNARWRAFLERLGEMPEDLEDLATPEEIVAEAEIPDVVAQLPPVQREIARAMMDGQSVYQIARRTGRHYETVRRQVRRIRRTLAAKGLDPWRA